MAIVHRWIREWLVLVLLAGIVALSGCGERNDLRHPDLPPGHPLNHRNIW